MKATFRTIEISDPRFEFDGLSQITVKSAALKGRADLTLWPRSGQERPQAIVILLHGVYGSHWAWALKGGAHKTASRLMEAGEIPQMTLVMPSDGLWGDGSGYVAHRTQDYGRWIAEELPELTLQVLPSVRSDTPFFIAGLSMGGFGALRIGAKYWARFRGISGHSSITHFDQLSQFVEEDLASYHASLDERSVLETILANRDRLPPLRFDCGTHDPLLAHNRELHEQLKANAIPHTYEEFLGGHEWPYWEEHLADTLRFFASTLDNPTKQKETAQ
ncbi:alpha/beta hydrolase [Verrucomicrobiota bacterium sgz303538]